MKINYKKLWIMLIEKGISKVVVLNIERCEVAKEVNTQLLTSYWKIGEVTVRYEQNDNIRAEYGAKTLKELSKALINKLGKVFSVSNIQFMRRFYLEYPI